MGPGRSKKQLAGVYREKFARGRAPGVLHRNCPQLKRRAHRSRELLLLLLRWLEWWCGTSLRAAEEETAEEETGCASPKRSNVGRRERGGHKVLHPRNQIAWIHLGHRCEHLDKIFEVAPVWIEIKQRECYTNHSHSRTLV